MTSRHRPLHRSDSTKAELVKAARDLGFRYHDQDGSIDGVLWLPMTGGLGHVVEVDFKAGRGKLTPRQIALTREGWPIRVIHEAFQLEALRDELLPALAREGRG